MLIRKPELAFNTENKRIPRGGRRRQYPCGGGGSTDSTGVGGYGGVVDFAGGPRYAPKQKRAADKEGEEDPTIEEESYHSKAYWVDLFNGFAEMTNPDNSDLALFLYCMLN